jgi:hypothetical protein
MNLYGARAARDAPSAPSVPGPLRGPSSSVPERSGDSSS